MSQTSNLEQRGDKWYLRIVIDDKLYRRSTGFKDLKRARRRANEMEGEIREGKAGWIKKDAPLFAVWAKAFLERYHRGRETEHMLMRRPMDRWGTKPMDTLEDSHFREYFSIREQDDHAAKGTVERERVLLKQCFTAAMRDNLIKSNPLAAIKGFKTVPRDQKMSAAQETAYRKYFADRGLDHWDRFLTIGLGTGLRALELHMARPMDLRDGGKWLEVRPESNKKRKSRLVPLRPEVRVALAAQAAARTGGPDVTYWAPRNESSVGQAFARVSKYLGEAERMGIHSLRRTFATRAVDAGMHPKHLQLILGHEKMETTMLYYVHLEQVSVMDAILKVKL